MNTPSNRWQVPRAPSPVLTVGRRSVHNTRHGHVCATAAATTAGRRAAAAAATS